jgi:hypothetical protein
MSIVPNKFLVKIGVCLLLVSSYSTQAQAGPPPPTPPPPGTPIDNWMPALLVVGLLIAFYKLKNKKTKKTLN